jgi:hypothetical protein
LLWRVDFGDRFHGMEDPEWGFDPEDTLGVFWGIKM